MPDNYFKKRCDINQLDETMSGILFKDALGMEEFEIESEDKFGFSRFHLKSLYF